MLIAEVFENLVDVFFFIQQGQSMQQIAPFEVSKAEPAAAALVLLVEDSMNDCLSIPAHT